MLKGTHPENPPALLLQAHDMGRVVNTEQRGAGGMRGDDELSVFSCCSYAQRLVIQNWARGCRLSRDHDLILS